MDVHGLSNYLSRYDRYRQEKPIKCYFLTVVLLFAILTGIAGVLTGGEAIWRILFQIRTATWSDFYSSFHSTYNITTDIYPPLGQTIFLLLDNLSYVAPGQLSVTHLFGIVFYTLFFSVVYLALIFRLRKVNTSSVKEKILLSLALVLSLPSLYCLERGNILPVALLCLCLYLSYYDSENRWVRICAYICLGFSVGFKIYPVVFSLLILRQRRYQEFILCAIIVAGMFLLPYCFTQGGFIEHMQFIFGFAGEHQSNVSYDHINIVNILCCFGLVINYDLHTVAQIFAYAVGFFMIILVLWDKAMEKWKIYACLAVLAIGCIGFRPVYAIMFFIPALVLFLDNNRGLNSIDLVYLICFILMFTPFLQIFFEIDGVSVVGSATIGKMGITTLLEGLGIIIMGVTIIYEFLKGHFFTHKEEETV